MKKRFHGLSFTLTLIIFLISVTLESNASERSDSIRTALEYQIKYYPSSQLRDIYKNFMQDYFGPGHLLNDTSASGKYLRHELATTENFDGPDYEKTGFQGNFYRVNIKLIKDNTVPYDTYFNAFVESVQSIVPPLPQTWMAIWNEIDNEIISMGLKFQNEEADRKALTEQFENNNFVVHHSDAYNDAVNFHYRIISKEIFEKEILPLLQTKN